MSKIQVSDATRDRADDAFWKVIAEAYPQVKSGDFPPDATFRFHEAERQAVDTWLDYNYPRYSYVAKLYIRHQSDELLDRDVAEFIRGLHGDLDASDVVMVDLHKLPSPVFDAIVEDLAGGSEQS